MDVNEQALREDYKNASTYRRVRMPYDDLLEMFRDPYMTYEQIGNKLGVTREMVRLVYNAFFRLVLGGASGHERRKSRTLAKLAEELSDPPVCAYGSSAYYIMRTAREEGLECLRVHCSTHGSSVSWERNVLIINGWTAKTRKGSRWVTNSGLIYYRVDRSRITPTEFDYVLCWVEPEDVYVIPLADVMKIGHLYIPRGERHKNGPAPMVDFEIYRNNWEPLRVHKEATKDVEEPKNQS